MTCCDGRGQSKPLNTFSMRVVCAGQVIMWKQVMIVTIPNLSPSHGRPWGLTAWNAENTLRDALVLPSGPRRSERLLCLLMRVDLTARYTVFHVTACQHAALPATILPYTDACTQECTPRIWLFHCRKTLTQLGHGTHVTENERERESVGAKRICYLWPKGVRCLFICMCVCVCVFARVCQNLQRNLAFLRVLLSADSANISTNCLEECPGAGDGHPAHPYAHLHHFAFESSHTCVLARRGRIKPLFDICL